MAVHIANPQVVSKIEHLSHLTGLGKTAAVERALDHMIASLEQVSQQDDRWAGFDAALAQFHELPDRMDAFDAVEYDEFGVPK